MNLVKPTNSFWYFNLLLYINIYSYFFLIQIFVTIIGKILFTKVLVF